MISGFDYGTSNCALGVINSTTQKAQLLPLENDQYFLPSALYALGRELVCEQVASGITNQKIHREYLQSRNASLSAAKQFRRKESIGQDEQSLFFGQQAFDNYFNLPGEGYFVKSPKSFLGASGLRVEHIRFFEDLVTAMMMHVKQRAEAQCQTALTDTVIGRPVNFQGLNSNENNAQAIAILGVAAQRAGFKSVEFLYEPIAAGLDFERQLTQDKKVLVIDIGGGTSDCAMVCMGPSHRDKADRQNDFIGHSGERIGGNDFDIQIASKALLPLFGMNSHLKSGLPMPTQIFWNAASTNDVGAQADFNSLQTTLLIERLQIETRKPKLFERFVKMRKHRQNQHVVASAEQAKIQLSDSKQVDVALDYIEAGLASSVTFEAMKEAVRGPLTQMINVVNETIAQAAVKPDLIYITGGSARSPVIRQFITEQIGNVEVVDGDHFGSVANGLTLWANRIFK
ncbi:MAG: molecular chaperone [Pseudomonadales bacterium]|nr:molecular chaperone [Pseudomonadales bacterium]MDG1441739.1 molecular chaperone [Pseudomonadales bacterium]